MVPDGTKGKVMRLAGSLWTKFKDSVEDVSIQNVPWVMFYNDTLLET